MLAGGAQDFFSWEHAKISWAPPRKRTQKFLLGTFYMKRAQEISFLEQISWAPPRKRAHDITS